MAVQRGPALPGQRPEHHHQGRRVQGHCPGPRAPRPRRRVQPAVGRRPGLHDDVGPDRRVRGPRGGDPPRGRVRLGCLIQRCRGRRVLGRTYGPKAATQADAARASMRTATVNADRTATAADREQAAEAEMAAYESYWHAHSVPAYAETSARQGLVREHTARGHRDPRRRSRARGFRGGFVNAERDVERVRDRRARTQPPARDRARRSGGNHDRT